MHARLVDHRPPSGDRVLKDVHQGGGSNGFATHHAVWGNRAGVYDWVLTINVAFEFRLVNSHSCPIYHGELGVTLAVHFLLQCDRWSGVRLRRTALLKGGLSVVYLRLRHSTLLKGTRSVINHIVISICLHLYLAFTSRRIGLLYLVAIVPKALVLDLGLSRILLCYPRTRGPPCSLVRSRAFNSVGDDDQPPVGTTY